MKEEEEECILKSDICEDVENRSDRIRHCCVQIAKVLIKNENVRKYWAKAKKFCPIFSYKFWNFGSWTI